MSTLVPVTLRCEHQHDPLAIERPDPRLSWISSASARGAKQSAYRVVAAGSESDLLGGRALLWDSGKVASDRSAHIHYAGKPLGSFQRVCWRVQLWDEHGAESSWSPVGRFAMGVLKREEWRAQWIGTPLHMCPNSPYYRRAFRTEKPVVDARLYATARGIYLAWIDGTPVSDEQLAPGWTDYSKRILYRCYDLTDAFAKPGEHVLGAQLNDGWYKGPVGWENKAGLWGNMTQLLLMLRLEHADGSVTWIVSDGEWKTANSPTLASTFLRGEVHDAALERDGWNRPGYDDKGWLKVHTGGIGDAPLLQAHAGPPVRRLAEVKAQAKWQPRPGVWIFDIGENIAGRVRISVKAPAGTTIRLRHGEMVTPERELYVDNLRAALSTDLYTAKGAGVEEWEPRFTFHGFQYVEVAGWPGEPRLEDITGVVVGSDCAVAGEFSCSNPDIDRLYANLVRTQRANYIDIPTDCPQRDERLGWTGDAQAYIRTAICSRDIAGFFTKWLQDLRDAQNAEGCFPNVAPQVPLLGDSWGLAKGDAAWGDAGTICPWTIWRCYDDRDELARSYPAMVKWVEYLERTALTWVNLRFHRSGIGPVFGDWLQVDCQTPLEVIMTAFYARSTEITAEAAEALGKADDAKRFRELHAKIKAAFIKEFVRADGVVVGRSTSDETQTNQLLALHFDLVSEESRGAVFAKLIAALEKRNWYLSTGFVGLPYLLPVLSRHGRTDVAYRLLLNQGYPSWLYPITQGATTIWERWNGWKKDEGPADPGMNSYSHYAYGACGEWLFSDVAGIDLIERGFKKLRVRPRIGGSLTRASARHECLYGAIRSDWSVNGREVALAVEIPANTTAEVWVPTSDAATLREGATPWKGAVRHEPGYAVVEVGAGTYRFAAAFAVPEARAAAR
jgi:alpha-L-rhamnosidase